MNRRVPTPTDPIIHLYSRARLACAALIALLATVVSLGASTARAGAITPDGPLAGAASTTTASTSDDTDPDTDPSTDPSDESVRIATYNIRADRNLPQFVEGASAVMDRADIVGFQEITTFNKHEWLMEQEESGEWGYFVPDERLQEPVVWNAERFRFIKGLGVPLVKRSAHGDDDEKDTKRNIVYGTYVRLADRVTDKQFTIFNVHLQHGVVKAGKPNKAAEKEKYAVYRAEVQAVRKYAEYEQRHGRGQMFIIGDYNAGYVPDARNRHPDLPYANLTPLGLKSMWRESTYLRARQGTRNDALIDQVWSPYEAIDTYIDHDVTVSDHFPAIATYASVNG